MPFPAEFPVDEFDLNSADLHLSLVGPGDAADGFALLTHQDLEFVEDEALPQSQEALRDFYRSLREREYNDEDYRIYAWTARAEQDGELVALVTAVLKADGPDHTGEESRVVELTVYVAPPHQGGGRRHGRQAADEVLRFAVERLGATHLEVLIRPENTKARHLIEELGMDYIYNTNTGLECWRKPLAKPRT